MATSAVTPYQYPQPQFVQYDENGNPIDPSTGAAPAPAAGATPPASIYGGPSGSSAIPPLNTDPEAPIHDMFYNDEAIENAGANQINNEATSQLNYYDPLQQQAQGQAEGALSQLQAQPGYTPGQEAQINVDYGANKTSDADLNKQFLTSDEQSAITGDPSAAVTTMGQGVIGEGEQLNQYQANLGGQLAQYGSNLSGQVQNNAAGVGGAAADNATGVAGASTGLGTGLAGAQGKFSNLDTAVNNPALAFDPNNTEKQLTDADVQEMKTAAGTRIGNQYGSAEDTLERQAAAAGNTSPLALAAARSRLQTQEASDQGDAETNADIAARQAQEQQAAAIEAQREGAVNTATGYKANAATTEEAAAQAAAGLAGTQDIAAQENIGSQNLAAQENIGQTGVGAANTLGAANVAASNTYGQFSTNTAGNIANQDYNAVNAADTAASQRAAQEATDRQATQANVSNTQYGQGMATQQATSGGAQTVGNADIAGRNAYLSGVTQQQGLAQQGGQAAVGQQQQALATQTSGLNSSTAARAGYENSGPGALGKAGSQILGDVISGASSAAKFLDDGAIVTEPTVAVIGERRPEMVIPLTYQYGVNRRKAA